jgi:hypothetical protein
MLASERSSPPNQIGRPRTRSLTTIPQLYSRGTEPPRSEGPGPGASPESRDQRAGPGEAPRRPTRREGCAARKLGGNGITQSRLTRPRLRPTKWTGRRQFDVAARKGRSSSRPFGSGCPVVSQPSNDGRGDRPTPMPAISGESGSSFLPTRLYAPSRIGCRNLAPREKNAGDNSRAASSVICLTRIRTEGEYGRLSPLHLVPAGTRPQERRRDIFIKSRL